MTSVDLNLDDDELRARAIQGMGPASWPLPLSPVLAPPGLSPNSSIGPVEREAATPQHRPALASPTHIMCKLLSMHNETERLTARNAEQFEADVTRGMADIDRLAAEKDEALRNEAEAIKSRATWSALSTIAEYITGIASIMLGAAIYSVAAIPGALIIAAGAVGTANRVIHDTHILHALVEWYTKSVEVQKRITSFIETSAFFLQMGLGLAGGIGAWKVGAFTAMNAASGTDIVQKMVSVIAPASAVISSGTRIGVKFHEKRISDAMAQMKEIDCEMAFESQSMTKETAKINRGIEDTESQVEVLRKAIKTLEVSQD